jgi:hypothetical protein
LSRQLPRDAVMGGQIGLIFGLHTVRLTESASGRADRHVSARKSKMPWLRFGPVVRLFLDLCPEPDTELQNPLELFRAVEPTIVVTDRMCGQIVVCCLLATKGVGEDVIGLPWSLDPTSADVAAPASLSENLIPFRPRECLPRHLVSNCELSLATLFMARP